MNENKSLLYRLNFAYERGDGFRDFGKNRLSTHDLDLALCSADIIWLLPKDSAMQVDVSEELVLNGAFAKAFAGEGIEFDSQLGAFRVAQPQGTEIAVSGTGVAALWTRRALERQGFRVVDAATPTLTRVEVIADNSPAWQLTTKNGNTRETSLQALLARLTQ